MVYMCVLGMGTHAHNDKREYPMSCYMTFFLIPLRQSLLLNPELSMFFS